MRKERDLERNLQITALEKDDDRSVNKSSIKFASQLDTRKKRCLGVGPYDEQNAKNNLTRTCCDVCTEWIKYRHHSRHPNSWDRLSSVEDRYVWDTPGQFYSAAWSFLEIKFTTASKHRCGAQEPTKHKSSETSWFSKPVSVSCYCRKARSTVDLVICRQVQDCRWQLMSYHKYSKKNGGSKMITRTRTGLI